MSVQPTSGGRQNMHGVLLQGKGCSHDMPGMGDVCDPLDERRMSVSHRNGAVCM